MYLFIFLVRSADFSKNKISAKSHTDYNTHELPNGNKNSRSKNDCSFTKNKFKNQHIHKNDYLRYRSSMNDAAEELKAKLKREITSRNILQNNKKYPNYILKKQNLQQTQFIERVQHERGKMEKIMNHLIPGKTNLETKDDLKKLQKDLDDLLIFLENMVHA